MRFEVSSTSTTTPRAEPAAGRGPAWVEWQTPEPFRPGDVLRGDVVVRGAGPARDFEHLEVRLVARTRYVGDGTSTRGDDAELVRLLLHGPGRTTGGPEAVRVPVELELPWDVAASRLAGQPLHLADGTVLRVAVKLGRASALEHDVTLVTEPAPPVEALVQGLLAAGHALERADTVQERQARSAVPFCQRWTFRGGDPEHLELRAWPAADLTVFELRVPRAFRRDVTAVGRVPDGEPAAAPLAAALAALA